MTHTIFITSNYFVRKIIFNWIVCILVLADIFFSEYIPKDIRSLAEIVLMFIYIVLVLLATFYLCFISYSKSEIKYEIKKLQEEKEKASLNHFYNGNFEKENSLLLLKRAQQAFGSTKEFVHILKTKEELTNSKSNLGNYFLILLLLWVGQDSFDYLNPIGTILFIVIIAICIISCLSIIIWEGIEQKNFISTITIGFGIAIYLLFGFGKNTYVRNYGDEIIGSYFEKREYKTQYYINAFSDWKNSKSYRLPADIHVYSETEEGETEEGFFAPDFSRSYTSKHIALERVYWPNGGSLDFEESKLEINEKVPCTDEDGKEWYIELTDKKVK